MRWQSSDKLMNPETSIDGFPSKYLQEIWLDSFYEILLRQLTQQRGVRHLEEFLLQEVQSLPVYPVWTMGLRAPVEDG